MTSYVIFWRALRILSIDDVETISTMHQSGDICKIHQNMPKEVIDMIIKQMYNKIALK